MQTNKMPVSPDRFRPRMLFSGRYVHLPAPSALPSHHPASDLQMYKAYPLTYEGSHPCCSDIFLQFSHRLLPVLKKNRLLPVQFLPVLHPQIHLACLPVCQVQMQFQVMAEPFFCISCHSSKLS